MSASVRDGERVDARDEGMGKICTLFNRGVRGGVGEIHTPE